VVSAGVPCRSGPTSPGLFTVLRVLSEERGVLEEEEEEKEKEEEEEEEEGSFGAEQPC